ncbi:MAG: hypothetical protein K8T90_00910 [Planctomycetes bacterium]|nr:hypothetical protein [Planctomycetota bacterium]
MDLRSSVAAGVLLTALAFVPGCSSARDAAVPGCPVCGDPRTTMGADGRGIVLGRLRIRSHGTAAIHAAMGLVPWALDRSDGGVNGGVGADVEPARGSDPGAAESVAPR